jgi:hypothetical protein
MDEEKKKRVKSLIMQGLDASEYDSSESEIPLTASEPPPDEQIGPRGKSVVSIPTSDERPVETTAEKDRGKTRKSKYEVQAALLADRQVDPVKKLLKLWDYLHPSS